MSNAGSSLGFKFMTPEIYSKSQESHFIMNTNAVNEYVEVCGPLNQDDKVLDFGSGTGETPTAIAQGVLGNLGKPGFVTGSDLSHDMIKHCRKKYSIKNLEFHQLDVTDGEEFGDRHADQFSLVTSFSCLHWVNDHQAATKLTARVLKKGGKFLHLVLGGYHEQSHVYRIFTEMKTEDKWRKMLENVRWKTFLTKHVNNEWSSTIDVDGYGPMYEDDYKRLMESNGFRVFVAKPYPLTYKVTKDYEERCNQKMIFEAFPELSHEERKLFLKEYKARLQSASIPDADGLFHARCHGFLIFGEKI